MTTIAEHLRNSLDGRWRDVKNQMRARLSEDVFRPHYTPNTVIARTKVAEQMSIMAAAGEADDGFRKEHGGNGNVGAAVTMIEMLAMSDLSLMVKAGVQWGLFGGAVENLGTERHHEAYVKKIISLELPGCFAMTETGHGSDVQALETIATYDPDTEEFVIHSSTPNARKDYIGGAAETAIIAAVFAQLVTTEDGEPVNHGVHCFLVPIRDDDGNDLPGVTTSDCQYKGGLPGVDNGRILFDHVRVPRVNLLNKYGDVEPDGTYTSPIENANRRFFTMIGTLIRGRVTVGGSAGAAARVALDIATRYALQRKQFTAPDDGGEVVIMDYLVHQRRLFPLIAKSYALQFAQNELVSKMPRPADRRLPRCRGAARAGVAGRRAESRQHLARVHRHPGGPRSMRRRRLYGRQPTDRAARRHRCVHHLRGRQPRADPAGGQGVADRLRRRHQGHEPGGMGAVRRQLRRRAGAQTHCGRDDHPDRHRRPAGQRRRRQPVQPRHSGPDVRGPRGIHHRLGGAPAAGQIERDVGVRRVQLGAGSRAARRASAHRPGGAGGVRRRDRHLRETTRPARSSGWSATSTR